MTVGTMLLIGLLVLLIGAFPIWPHSRGLGYWPSVIIALATGVVIALLVLKRI